jgi:integrative and conjugative element protein (TIGR02256 family)
MDIDYLAISGEEIAGKALTVQRASRLYRALVDGDSPYARFMKAVRLRPDAECVIFDVEPEVGQAPINDIRRCERMAVVCTQADDTYPEALALRADFPVVPHINLRTDEFPRSLCLYEEPWSEVRLRWTAPVYVERIRRWLALTAEGALHAADQPLEPILAGGSGHLVLPTDLFVGNAGENPERLNIFCLSDDPADNVFIAMRADRDNRNRLAFAATVLYAQPQPHGVIRRVPKTLADLHDLMLQAGLDLRGVLCERLIAWQLDPQLKASVLVIIAFLPKIRSEQGSVEATDICAFVTGKNIADLGHSLGIWDIKGGHLGTIIGGGQGSGDDVPIDMLDPMFALSRSLAARYNGLPPGDNTHVTAIGAGALGSQVMTKLIRAGFGKWKLIDRDFVLPHNVARHELTSPVVGYRKANAFAAWANSILEEPDVVTPIVADVLQPAAQSQAVAAALGEADIIADFSASVAVARRLASDKTAKGRRMSLFLNPTGTDFVLLAEDSERTSPLDFLEVLYYRAVATDPALAGHMDREEAPIRYARSCRDITSTVSEELVGLHSAIASRALRSTAAADAAAIRIWRADKHLQVRLIEVGATRRIEVDFGEWLICTDSILHDKIHQLRAARLPNETGGVLIGHVDSERRIIFIVDALPSPPDSREWPTVYIRGAVGLRDQVEEIQRKTATMLQYVGEWHSHPNGYSCCPSADDKKAFVWLTERMAVEDYPAVMLIEGNQERRWYLGQMA